MISKERDIVFLKKLISNDYINGVLNDYGENGVSDLKLILEFIPDIFKYITLRNYKSIKIFKSEEINLNHFGDVKIINDFSYLSRFESEILVIQVEKVDKLSVIITDIDIDTIIKSNFIYQFTNKEEKFITKSREYPLPNIPDAESCFSIPTFKTLDEALLHYKTFIARPALCGHIQNALHPNKIFFAPKPEQHLRKSLEYFLKIRIRAYTEIRPEQVVDESHPVDLKITWQGINHIALIEIKWLGKSLNTEGVRRFTSDHSDPRALSGAKQLVDYIDSNILRAPTHNTMGYLVIYDLRREGTVVTTDTINRVNGFHYENKEIDFNPKYHVLRNDFAEPIRMFIEPICS